MTSQSGEGTVKILLVEDDPADSRLTEEILKDVQQPTTVTVAADGETAMTRLRKEGEHESSPRPDLILLDLQLPGMDGWEVLRQIAAEPDLAKIPVIILTGTEAERSLLESYNIPPSRYCRKPIDLARLNSIVSQLDRLSDQPLLAPPAEAEPELVAARASGEGKKWWWPFG